MEQQLIISPSKYGIEETKASELLGNLPQLKAEREILSTQYNEVVKMDIDNPETSKIARELRLKIRDNRTKGIEVWHKNTKDYFLKGGQFVDAIKRMEIENNLRMEENLEQIEKHEELKQQKLKAERTLKRMELLYGFEVSQSQIEDMEDAIFDAFLSGLIAKKEEEAKEIKRIEEERIAKEKAEKEYQERIRIENERLKKEVEEKRILLAKRNDELRPFIIFIRDYNSLIEMSEDDYQKEFTEIKKGAELQWEFERKEAEKQESERLEQERIAKELAEKERIENERIAELQRIEAQRIAEEKKAQKAPDKSKLKSVISELSINLVELKSVESKEVLKQLTEKLDAYKKWANEQIEKL